MKKFAALVAVLALVAFAAPAFAANPFMDVPMNHWAYDAVSQLASRGVVSGYPDGAFKGEWKATRYEMASVVARALAYVDMNKASKQDLELLKKLVVEFKDELDALGVKVDELDSRVAVLETDIGGWSLSGQFRFDSKWADRVNGAYGLTQDTDFAVSRYRLFINKRIDDKVKFTARLGGETATFERYFLTVAMPWDSTLLVGKFHTDWEGEDGFYNDNDAWFTDQTVNGFYWSKMFSMGEFDLLVAHQEDTFADAWVAGTWTANVQQTWDAYYYAARIKFNFNETFGVGLVGIWRDYYDNTVLTGQQDWTTYWAQAYVNFTPEVTLRGRYIWQDQDLNPQGETNAWQAILQADQSLTGFTAIWIEYAQLDNGFFLDTADPYADWGQNVLGQVMANDTDVFFVRLDQQWNDKWATFERFISVDDNADNARVWTFGVKYWYTPALSFELSYDDTTYDITQDDSMIRFRTFVSF